MLCFIAACPICSVLLTESYDLGMQVMLVGHDFGGACVSYVMEKFPQKIAKAVFVSAFMVANGQSAFDLLSPEVCQFFGGRFYVHVCMGHANIELHTCATEGAIGRLT